MILAPLRLQIRLRLCGDRAGRPIRRFGQELQQAGKEKCLVGISMVFTGTPIAPRSQALTVGMMPPVILECQRKIIRNIESERDNGHVR